MHRTTIAMDSHIEKKLRQLSFKEKRSFKSLVNLLLKKGLESYQQGDILPSKTMVWHTVSSQPADFFDPADRSTYMEHISRKLT